MPISNIRMVTIKNNLFALFSILLFISYIWVSFPPSFHFLLYAALLCIFFFHLLYVVCSNLSSYSLYCLRYNINVCLHHNSLYSTKWIFYGGDFASFRVELRWFHKYVQILKIVFSKIILWGALNTYLITYRKLFNSKIGFCVWVMKIWVNTALFCFMLLIQLLLKKEFCLSFVDLSVPFSLCSIVELSIYHNKNGSNFIFISLLLVLFKKYF